MENENNASPAPAQNNNNATPAPAAPTAAPPMLSAASLGQSSRKIKEAGASKLAMAVLPGNLKQDVMNNNYVSFSVLLLGVLLLVSFPAPLLVLIFGCLRVDGDVNWPWLKLAIPLFILQGLCLLFLLMGILHPPKQPQGMSQKDPAYIIWKHQSGTFRWFCSFLQLICLIAVEVQIFGMMDGDIEEDLGYILPWFVYVFFEFFAVLARSRPALGSLEDDFPDIEQDRRAEAEAIISKLTSDFKNFVFGAIMRTLAVLFVMLKVDGEIGWNWFGVMWPVWVYAAGVLVSMQVRKQQAKSAPQVQVIQLPLRQQDGLQPQAQQVRVQLQSTNAKSEGAKVDALESVVFLYVMMAAMLCNKLEGRWDGSAWVLVSPLLIVLGCGYCACCCFICFSCLPDDKTDNGSSSV
uniref:Transmembrane protein n=1 Tax=Fibrocapsa japonica TaxID=94617 RepID=A0A7S2Y0W1_9STRA